MRREIGCFGCLAAALLSTAALAGARGYDRSLEEFPRQEGEQRPTGESSKPDRHSLCADDAGAEVSVGEIDPMIGVNSDGEMIDGHRKGSCGNVSPGALMPFGMVQLFPDTYPRWDNGYHYNSPDLEGFSFMHLSGIGYYGEFGNFEVMPTTGQRQLDFEKSRQTRDLASEKASAGFYSVLFPGSGIRTDLTASRHSGLLRFVFPRKALQRVQVDLSRRIGQKARWMCASRQTARIVGDRAVEGRMWCPCADGGWGKGEGGVSYTLHYRCEFSRPFGTHGSAEKGVVTAENAAEYAGSNLVFFAEFPASAEPLLMKVGFSFVDLEGARGNLAKEVPAWDFDALVRQARDAWAEMLGRVEVKGGTVRERKIFATSVYRACYDPRVIADVDGRHFGADGKVAGDPGYGYRTVFSGWDVFRQAMPLLTLLSPDVVSDTVRTMSAVMDESGRKTLPVWDIFGCKSGCMLGHPLLPVAADAWYRGIRDIPLARLCEQGMATSRRAGNGDLGYTACGWMDVSLTLEYAYDDWCVGRLLEAFGKRDEAAAFYRAGQNYRNIWNEEVQWFRQRLRDKDGKPAWAKWKGLDVPWQGTIESTPHQQGWFVPQDPYGLIGLLGGDGPFVEKLCRFMDAAPKYYSYTDAGYCHANEPDHHVPMLAHYAGRPDLTEKWTRNICEMAYDVGVNGLCGAEDEGQMSAWYVLSAIGLQTMCPGDGLWLITSPVFPETTIRLNPKYCKGKTFTIRASNTSKANIYIRSALLNGKRLDRLWLAASEVTDGGVLELDMASVPPASDWRRPPRIAVCRR